MLFNFVLAHCLLLFNPFNMIFPLAGRQKACQLSCVPFPSISGNRYSWIWMVFQYCTWTIHFPVHFILLLLKIKYSQWQAWNITSQDSKEVHSCPWLKLDVYKQVPVILLFLLQVFLIISYAPLVRQLAEIIFQGEISLSRKEASPEMVFNIWITLILKLIFSNEFYLFYRAIA